MSPPRIKVAAGTFGAGLVGRNSWRICPLQKDEIRQQRHFPVKKYQDALRSQGVSVGKDTLHEYLAHLEDAFVIRTVERHAPSERQRMVKCAESVSRGPQSDRAISRGAVASNGATRSRRRCSSSWSDVATRPRTCGRRTDSKWTFWRIAPGSLHSSCSPAGERRRRNLGA